MAFRSWISIIFRGSSCLGGSWIFMGDINMGYIGWDVVRLRHCSEVVMMNARTQNRRIIDWLAAGRSLTTMQAFTKWGVTRLSGRIYELRGEGHKIDAPMRAVGGKHVACYRLAR